VTQKSPGEIEIRGRARDHAQHGDLAWQSPSIAAYMSMDMSMGRHGGMDGHAGCRVDMSMSHVDN
jgi:hypothetical protein